MPCNRSIATVATLLAGVVCSGAAFAQTKTWNFGDITAPGHCTGNHGNMGNTAVCTEQPSGGATVNVNAFSANGAGANFTAAAVNYHGTGSGFGVANVIEGANVTGSPNHAMDNSASTDMLLLKFTSAQILRSVTVGWSGTDGDFQVLRWGSDDPLVSPLGKTAAQLMTAGWDLVSTVNGAGYIGNGGSNPADVKYDVNGNGRSSSYWLISAFNSAWGASSFNSTIDALKVLAVTGDKPNLASAPGSLALAGVALVGLFGVRRRVQRAA